MIAGLKAFGTKATSDGAFAYGWLSTDLFPILELKFTNECVQQ